MKLGQLRQRINDGDKDAAAYVEEKFEPIQEAFSRAAELAHFDPPMFSVDLAPPMPDLDLSGVYEAKAAAVAREQAMIDGLRELRDLAEEGALREINSEARERRMFWLTVASVAFGAIAAVTAVVVVILAIA